MFKNTYTALLHSIKLIHATPKQTVTHGRKFIIEQPTSVRQFLFN